MKRSAPLRNTGFKRAALPVREQRVIEYTPRPREVVKPVAVLLATKPVPKEVRFESEAWRRAVASLPCVLCGKVGETQAAHANRHGKGAMRKADDSLVAACCVACHHELDQGKSMTRDERRAELDRAIVLTVKALARAGLLVIVGTSA